MKRHGRGLRRRSWVAACLLVWLVAFAAPTLGADSTPSPATGDVRSTTAPGLVGDPLFAVAGVVVIGLVALGATLLYVRLTARP